MQTASDKADTAKQRAADQAYQMSRDAASDRKDAALVAAISGNTSKSKSKGRGR